MGFITVKLQKLVSPSRWEKKWTGFLCGPDDLLLAKEKSSSLRMTENISQ